MIDGRTDGWTDAWVGETSNRAAEAGAGAPDDDESTAVGDQHAADGMYDVTGEARDDSALRFGQPGSMENPLQLVQRGDGMYAKPGDRSDSQGGGQPPRGGGGRGDRDGSSGDRRPTPRSLRSGRGSAALLAGTAAVAVALTYGGAVLAENVVHDIGQSWDATGAAPSGAQADALKAALEPRAEAIAGQAIRLSTPHDGHASEFHATQVNPDEVDLRAGADDFQDGTTFSGRAGFVDVKLVGPGLKADDLDAGDAAYVSDVFVQETEGIPDSDGSAVDTQVEIAGPAASQARDRNDLLYAVGGGKEGEAWSGIYGVDDDRTDNGYQGYTSDTNVILTGPGPNDDMPEFDTGYWGGGSPPQLTADGGNASSVETAKDVAAQAGEVFRLALEDM